MWVAEDVALIGELKKNENLPKLARKDDGSYLCDYMGLKDPSIGPFVVLVGARDAEYNATGKILTPDQMVMVEEYHSLRESFAENVTIYSAKADGPVRENLKSLLDGDTATCAASYIYAAMRQTLLLEYLHRAALAFCIGFVKGFDPTGEKSWTGHATAECYVCGSRTKPDGSYLLSCAKCQKIFYCSKECQKIDWNRHKVGTYMHCTRTNETSV